MKENQKNNKPDPKVELKTNYEARKAAEAIAKIEKESDGLKKKSSKIHKKIIVLNFINVVLLVSIFYFLNKVTLLAKDIKELRSEQIVAQETTDAAVIATELERNSAHIGELEYLFLSQEGFLEFLDEVDAIAANGNVSEFDFPVRSSVDRQKRRGMPILIAFEGTQAQVNESLSRFWTLPFLYKITNVELEGNSANMSLRLGIFLIVNENFE